MNKKPRIPGLLSSEIWSKAIALGQERERKLAGDGPHRPYISQTEGWLLEELKREAEQELENHDDSDPEVST